MEGHTPGPWHLNARESVPDCCSFAIFDDPNLGEQICGFDEFDHLDEGHIAHLEANFHLIAAAPDLLEACEAAYSVLKGSTVYAIPGSPIPIADRLKAAIAKAKLQPTKTEDE